MPSFLVAVDEVTIIALPPLLIQAPLVKSTCPPVAVYWMGPKASEAHWPVMSMERVVLMATRLSFFPMTLGLLL